MVLFDSLTGKQNKSARKLLKQKCKLPKVNLHMGKTENNYESFFHHHHLCHYHFFILIWGKEKRKSMEMKPHILLFGTETKNQKVSEITHTTLLHPLQKAPTVTHTHNIYIYISSATNWKQTLLFHTHKKHALFATKKYILLLTTLSSSIVKSTFFCFLFCFNIMIFFIWVVSSVSFCFGVHSGYGCCCCHVIWFVLFIGT